MCTAAVSVAVAVGKHVLGSVTVLARLILVQSIRVRFPAEKPSRDRVQVTQRPHKPGHAGSIPAPATNTGQPSGDVLPPYCLPHHLRVAQLVERPAVNREVAGSRPAARAMPPIPLGDDARRGLRCPCLSEWFDPIWRVHWCVAQWSEHSVDNGEAAGSNPAAPTMPP